MNLFKATIKTFLKIYLSIKTKSKLGKQINLNQKTSLEGYNKVGDGTNISNSSIGFLSYIGINSNLSNSIVGRYTSISSNVSIIAGRHPTKEFVSTHPSFYSSSRHLPLRFGSENKFKEIYYIDDQEHVVRIGNDVWIGANVLILDGVTIGN